MSIGTPLTVQAETRCESDSEDTSDDRAWGAQGTYEPVVNRNRCEDKAACVTVCPYDVFEVRKMADDEYQALPVLARFKVWAHGKNTAYTPRADSCQACGLCVVACPEGAITLAAVGDAGADAQATDGEHCSTFPLARAVFEPAHGDRRGGHREPDPLVHG